MAVKRGNELPHIGRQETIRNSYVCGANRDVLLPPMMAGVMNVSESGQCLTRHNFKFYPGGKKRELGEGKLAIPCSHAHFR